MLVFPLWPFQNSGFSAHNHTWKVKVTRRSRFDLDELQPYSPRPSCMQFSWIMWNTSPERLHFSYKTQSLPLSKLAPDFHLASCSMVKNTAITFQEVSPFWMPSIPSSYTSQIAFLSLYCLLHFPVLFMQHRVFMELRTEGSLAFSEMSSSETGFLLCLTYLHFHCTNPGSSSAWSRLGQLIPWRPDHF